MVPIKEPIGVDLNVGPMPFSDQDRQVVSDIISHYKNTGEIPKLPRKSTSRRKKNVVNKDSVPESATSKTAKAKRIASHSDK